MPAAIKVTVKLYGVLRRHRPAMVPGAAHQPFTVELPAEATAVDLVTKLGLRPGSVSAIAVNGDSAAEDAPLQDGDQVRLFPPSAGG